MEMDRLAKVERRIEEAEADLKNAKAELKAAKEANNAEDAKLEEAVSYWKGVLDKRETRLNELLAEKRALKEGKEFAK